MGLKETLENDLKKAIRDKDEVRKTTLRLALAAIRNAEIAKGEGLDEQALISVLSQQAKQRRESMEQFAKGGRDDLVTMEQNELNIILEYLPRQLSEEEIRSHAREAIEQVEAASPAQMGEVMRVLMPQIKDRADGRLVSRIVREILTEAG